MKRGREERVVITGARRGKTVDIGARERRYLITMGLRVACFAAIAVVPGLWWKLACVLGAAVLPGIGVLLANAVDQRGSGGSAGGADQNQAPQLGPAGVIAGEVAPEGSTADS